MNISNKWIDYECLATGNKEKLERWGNVILNRVRSSYFPNTIYSVIFDKKNGTQFSPVSNGTIYNAPNQQSIIAAKICLEGYSVNTGVLYFVNASVVPNSWVVKNRQLFAKIGNHSFYY